MTIDSSQNSGKNSYLKFTQLFKRVSIWSIAPRRIGFNTFIHTLIRINLPFASSSYSSPFLMKSPVLFPKSFTIDNFRPPYGRSQSCTQNAQLSKMIFSGFSSAVTTSHSSSVNLNDWSISPTLGYSVIMNICEENDSYLKGVKHQ